MKFNLKFYEAWRAKGIMEMSRQWCAYKDDSTPVMTVWYIDLANDAPEVIPAPPEHPCDWLFACPAGQWASKPKGQACIQMARDAMASGKRVEAILIAGMRHNGEVPSEFYAATISDDLYYITFTSVEPSGRMRGYFTPKGAKSG